MGKKKQALWPIAIFGAGVLGLMVMGSGGQQGAPAPLGGPSPGSIEARLERLRANLQSLGANAQDQDLALKRVHLLLLMEEALIQRGWLKRSFGSFGESMSMISPSKQFRIVMQSLPAVSPDEPAFSINVHRAPGDPGTKVVSNYQSTLLSQPNTTAQTVVSLVAGKFE